MNQFQKLEFLSAAIVLLMALVALQAASAQQARFGRPRQADGPLPLPARFRRQTGELHKLSIGQLAALNNEAERAAAAEQSLLEADEQTLRRQLPELLARAHSDKALERALLRLVISASLRNSNQLQQQLASSGSQWQLDNLDSAQNNLAQYNQANSGSAGEFNPVRLGRLESSELANLESQLAGELPELTGQFGGGGGGGGGASAASVDKREYIKPCSFNAISCVRTPFRKLK